MKIQFKFTLSKGDFNQLNEDFESIEFKELKGNEDNEDTYEEVVIDTKDLIFEEFDDYIENWLNAGYKLELGERGFFNLI